MIDTGHGTNQRHPGGGGKRGMDMKKNIPLGLKIMTGVEFLVAVAFGAVAAQYLFVSFLEPRFFPVGILVAVLLGGLCYIFVFSVKNNLDMKKDAIKLHQALAAIYLFAAGGFSALFNNALHMARGRGLTQATRTAFWQDGLVYALIAYGVWTILYFRRKSVRDIMVNGE
jgi:hypothetical protein